MNWLKELLGIAPEIVAARTNLRVAEINAQSEAITVAANSEGAWEKMAAQGAANSWKDEYWTLILSVPLVLCFFPQFQGYVDQGFQELETVPVWYQWSIMASISFAFARKAMPDLKGLFARRVGVVD